MNLPIKSSDFKVKRQVATLTIILLLLVSWLSIFQFTPSVHGDTSVTTITTTTDNAGTRLPNERKLVYANGLYWAVFDNGTQSVIYYSADQLTWTFSSVFEATVTADELAVWQSGDYLNLVTLNSTDYVLYKRCLLNSNGLVTWSSSTSYVLSSIVGAYTNIALDVNDYPYVSFVDSTLKCGNLTKSSKLLIDSILNGYSKKVNVTSLIVIFNCSVTLRVTK